MSSNVVKFNQVIFKGEDTRVIDTNELLEAKLRAFEEMMKNAKVEEVVDGFTEGLDAKHVEMLLEEEEIPQEAYEGPSAEELVEQALIEIEEMKRQAMAEAEMLAQQIAEEAKQSGYQEGYEQGMQDAASKAADKERKLLLKEQQLENEYEKKLEEMEPLLVDTIASIYEHVFSVRVDEMKASILYLIQNTIRAADGCRDFIIHVAKEDYSFVMEKKEAIIEKMLGSATVEIIEDAFVPEGGCLIETQSGIFDCGMDTQLKELGKQLRVLSYEK